MTKEELIALSDLNREDNIKYISSEAQGIAIALDSDRYAPTFCKLERAYICGRRKSEEQIAELEKQVKEWKALQEMFDGKSFKLEGEITNLHKQILKLEKENAELKAELSENKVADCHIVNGLCEQLTKAKEIIKKYYKYNPSCEYFYEDIDKEAEQFLKDSEVEK